MTLILDPDLDIMKLYLRFWVTAFKSRSPNRADSSVILINENENGEKRKNNEFVNEN